MPPYYFFLLIFSLGDGNPAILPNTHSSRSNILLKSYPLAIATKKMSTPIAPLTTTFSDFYQSYTTPFSATDIFTYWEQGPPLPTATSCFPSGWNSLSFFSPGICPSSYAIACFSTVSLSTDIETCATCCLSGYECQISSAATATNDLLVKDDLCTKTNFIGTITVTDVESGTTSFAVITDPLLNARGVSIRYRDGYFVGSAVAPTSSADGDATNTDIPDAETTLSVGAIVGIGIAVLLLASVIAPGLGFFILKRRGHGSSRRGQIRVAMKEDENSRGWQEQVHNQENGPTRKFELEETSMRTELAIGTGDSWKIVEYRERGEVYELQ